MTEKKYEITDRIYPIAFTNASYSTVDNSLQIYEIRYNETTKVK